MISNDYGIYSLQGGIFKSLTLDNQEREARQITRGGSTLELESAPGMPDRD